MATKRHKNPAANAALEGPHARAMGIHLHDKTFFAPFYGQPSDPISRA
jgi:hypothetical protein